ncbi:uncharacterized protein [Triticum aestivum]|uniref:uncharacterized protein n=1 Tax=Triticum aestivum TaxID=4565 RepID=UPI001D001B5F|nr:uncharacterized protein LOC123084346 [Triticum aestivum]
MVEAATDQRGRGEEKASAHAPLFRFRADVNPAKKWAGNGHPSLSKQPHVLILINCSSTQTSSSRSCLTCLASVSRSCRCILAPASPTTSHARSCNRRTEELLPDTPGAATGGQRSYKPGTKPTTAVLDSARRGAATGRLNSYNYLLFLLGLVKNFGATIDACSSGESNICSLRICAQLVLYPNSTMRAALAMDNILLACGPSPTDGLSRMMICTLHSARRRGQPPSKDASTSAWQSPSVGPGAATNQTNDGTCDDRVVSATVRSTIAGTSFFFGWNYHYFLLELFFFATIN